MSSRQVSLQIWASIALFMGGATTGILSVVLAKLAAGDPVLVPTWVLWGSYACYSLAVMTCLFVQNARVLGWLVFTFFVVLLFPEIVIIVAGIEWFDRNRAQWVYELVPTSALVLMSLACIYMVMFPPWGPSEPAGDTSKAE